IRSFHVTGVQTCALPICRNGVSGRIGRQPPIRGPPTGLSGTGSGFGDGRPGGGTSDVSTGGGGAAWFAHGFDVVGGVGWAACAGARLPAASKPQSAAVSTRRERRDTSAG